MTTDTEAGDPFPSWLPPAVLHAIRESAGKSDPSRDGAYAGVGAERVRRAIDRGDDILAAQRCYGDDDVADAVLARAALVMARAMLRPLAGKSDG
jgi:hypothetical protein